MVELRSGACWFCEGLYCWFCLLQKDRYSEHTQCSQTDLQDQKVLQKRRDKILPLSEMS